ncbi:thiol peroxidase [Metabacillus herbersteinensis]|uniref:Thiol peroxidase n=1 Tax=Metabacillus herbersteinensis TaxID=283816 RepID=A0ABV6GPY3_9BACI
MTNRRSNVVTLKNNPVTLIGPEVQVGDKAPDFEVSDHNLSKINLKDTSGKVRLIITVPSLDTPVCDKETRDFSEKVSSFGDDVTLLVISSDLPFAQKRWCGGAGLSNVQTLSDHFNMSFGGSYGTHIEELRLNCRAVFVVDANDKVTYVEYVQETTDYPDYQKALEAVKEALQLVK